jgi:hypothetical protein
VSKSRSRHRRSWPSALLKKLKKQFKLFVLRSSGPSEMAGRFVLAVL